DQSARESHFIHYLITRIDAGRTSYTVKLNAIADIDTGRTNEHTFFAINTITSCARFSFFKSATWFTPLVIVRYLHRVFVEHHTLKPPIRTNGCAYDFTDKGKDAVEQQRKNNQADKHTDIV